jgi:hypothetical protein
LDRVHSNSLLEELRMSFREPTNVPLGPCTYSGDFWKIYVEKAKRKFSDEMDGAHQLGGA